MNWATIDVKISWPKSIFGFFSRIKIEALRPTSLVYELKTGI